MNPNESPPPPVGLSDEAFARFAEFIEGEFGIRIPHSKRALIEARLSKRVRELQLPDLEAYYRYFFGKQGALEGQFFLADVITTNKSDFFREPKHFEFIQRWIECEPDVWRNRVFRVWSAGCATGEEPYTLAMLFTEFAAEHPGFEFSILATDVSQRVLDEAVRGVFHASKLDAVPPAFQHKFFLSSKDPDKKVVRIVPEIRSKVRFARLNFIQPEYPILERFDLILFRNVMIYFPTEIQVQTVNRLCRFLRPGGYFLPGHTESLNGFAVPLRPLAPAIYERITPKELTA